MNIHIHGNKLLVEQVHKHQLQKTELGNLMNIHIHGNYCKNTFNINIDTVNIAIFSPGRVSGGGAITGYPS